MRKRSIEKKCAAILFAASLSLGVAACGTTDGGYDSSEGGAKTASGSEWDMTNTIVYGSNDYTRINPAMDEHGEINALLFDGLTDHDGDNQVVPRLAKSWDYDESTYTYTFHLEEGEMARWSAVYSR